jgi:hypothetical protein
VAARRAVLVLVMAVPSTVWGQSGAPPVLACPVELVADQVLALFPPASAPARRQAAQWLGRCRADRAAGALGVALDHDPDLGVRLEAATALAAVGTQPARERLHAALAATAPRPLRARIVDGLAELGDLEPLAALVVRRDEDDELRARALRALARTAGPVDRAFLDRLGTDAGPALADAIAAVRPAPEPPVVVAPLPLPAPAAAGSRDRTEEPPVVRVRPRVEPPRPMDGTSLAVTTSILAGSVWGGSLALLAQQDSLGVITLVGTAGAVIGGGTAWGLTRFGVRPTPGQALWFTNATGWGALGGLMAAAGSGSSSPKLKYGLLVAGESVGVAAGIAGAHGLVWTPGQVALANSLVLGAGVGLVGVETLRDPERPPQVSPLAGYGTAPAMVAAALGARALTPSVADVHLAAATGVAAGWTTGLVASGLAGRALLEDVHGPAGMAAGVGIGYLAGTALGTIAEIPVERSWLGAMGMLAGNVMGRGAHMVIDPDGETRWQVGAGIGGAAAALAAFGAYHHLEPGPAATSLVPAGAAFGAIPWLVAVRAGAPGPVSGPRRDGGAEALATAGAIGGLLVSRRFDPDPVDEVTVAASTALGMGAGLGAVRLATSTSEPGAADTVGVLAGAAGGLGAGALFTHRTRLRPPEVGAALSGAGYGLLFGALAPTLSDAMWEPGRATSGGGWLGLASGAFGGLALARAVDADGSQIAVPVTAGLLGVGMGVGAGLAWPAEGSRAARVGAIAGPTALMTASVLAEPALQLHRGLGPSAPALAFWGTVAGIGEGWVATGLVAGSDDALAARQRRGTLLAGGSAGLASGLVLSRFIEPGTLDYTAALGGGLLGGALGAGAATLWLDEDGGRRGPAAALAGMSAGLLGGGLVAHQVTLRPADLGAGVMGAGYGALLGALVPTLADDDLSDTDQRRAGGGARVGLAVGGVAAAIAAHLTEASGGRVAVASTGAAFGAIAGAGAGMMTGSPRGARIGAVSGTVVYGTASLLLDRSLRLSEGLGPSAAGLSLTGATLGYADGVLLAAVVSGSGRDTAPAQSSGGALLGSATGVAAGLALSKVFQPDARDDVVAVGGNALGAALGMGGAMLFTPAPGRAERVATLAGGLGGLAAAAVVEHQSPLTVEDGLALPVGAGFGGLVGALVPGLGEPRWPGWDRRAQGGMLAGLAAGGLGAVALRHASDAPATTVGWTTLGGADGAATGLGVGLLVDEEGDRGARAGTAAGTVAGLVVGGSLWPHLHLEHDDQLAVGATVAVAGWTGGWAPLLGHPRAGDVAGGRRVGAILASGGSASFVAAVLLPPLHVQADLVGDALLLDGLLSGAGAGVGALVTHRDDGPVFGLLGAGTAGLLLGGGFHRSLDLGSDDAPLLALASLEGFWYGAWLPSLVRTPGTVSARDREGALAAGALGGAAAAVIASPLVGLDGRQAALTGLGSALGASIAGGSALLSDLDDQRRTAVLLGGSTAGLTLGAALAPRLELQRPATSYAATGAVLGAGEGLVFGWAGRATGEGQYAGATLVGAGVGTTLGLAAAAYPQFTLQRGLGATGFAAWGAWVGAFSGALANRDPHEVTLGGLAGTNAGFLAGYALLRTGALEARDFGWLSLAGAVGTVAGGGLGAVLSTRSDPRPILAGLAIGPLAGMAGGALLLPALRTFSARLSSLAPVRVAGMQLSFPTRGSKEPPAAPELPSPSSAEIVAGKRPGLVRRVRRCVDQVVGVSSWTPTLISLPPPPGASGGPAVLIGAAGLLR